MKDVVGGSESIVSLMSILGQLFVTPARAPLSGDAEKLAATSPTLWWSKRDDEFYFDIRLALRDAEWIHTVCRIILKPDGTTDLQTAFGTDVLDYAMPEDFPLQEALNETLAEALDRDLGGPLADQAFGALLRSRWQASRARIEAIWAESAKANTGVERLSLVSRFGTPSRGIAAPSTRLGQTRFVGVFFNGTKYEKISSKIYTSIKASYYTQAMLAKEKTLSGHEKLQYLSDGSGCAHYSEALPAFHRARGANQAWRSHRHHCRPAETAYPMACDDAVADLDQQCRITVTFANGDESELRVGGDGWKWMQSRHELPRLKTNIWISWDKDKSQFDIERGTTNERRFISVDLLDQALQSALASVLAIDPVWPDWLVEHFTGNYDADHPLLAGLTVPPRHQALVGTLLGAPYDRAKIGAEKLAAIRARKAAKRDAVDTTALDLPDGTLFAQLRKGVSPDSAELKKADVNRLCVVVTASEPGAKRRRRALLGLGAHRDTPFTPKHLTKVAPLTHPEAVRRISDYDLGGHSRELYEAAFFVSRHLPPAAENPLLKVDPEIGGLEIGNDPVTTVRFSLVAETDGYRLVAYRVLRVPKVEFLHHSSAGVIFLQTPKGEEMFMLPSTLPRAKAFPEDDLAPLTEAITTTHHKKPELGKDRLDRFTEAWKSQTTGSKKT